MDRDAIAHLLTGRIQQRSVPRPKPSAGLVPAPSPQAPPTGTDPAAVPRLADLPGELPVAWEVIEELQVKVSAELSSRDAQRLLEEEDRRALARSLTTSAVADWAALHAQGHTPLSAEQEAAVRHAVFDAMYRGGRLQSLLDEEGVEDVMVDGTTASVEYNHRPRRTVERVADSHQELITWVNRMAQLSGHGERALSQATPSVGFRMPDGSRVTASLLTTRPSVVIRKHNTRQHGIEALLQWGSINPLLERFLVAAVRARMNILVVGDMGAGKTSLLRALGREIPVEERLVTLESDRELYLDEPGPKGPLTFAFEARQSNGERSGNNQLAGEVTLTDIFETALRYNATRVIVGEVRGREILPMLKAMSASGSGSMCTMHVRRPHAIVSRLVQLCTEAGMASESAHHLIASSIDMVVYLTYRDETALGGRKHRYVSHIYEVHDEVGEGGRPVTTDLFAPTESEPRAVYRNMPSFIEDLELTGIFHRQWLTDNPHGAWGAPLQTVRPR
ncbi:ATP/GTP-binding protein [Streptomyces spiroverticillatus]|uniref:ATP/GTP-binding protein n=1 Tax=Streptomyces finlayi TaxID=67296 RepID=A0A919CET0_9ACTN|nr:CpaF/VirB11 family protein [Streptomyces finlayi]GHA46428.1 ATP/GTP-binding protein [Streptomyces spiroverticillatus]GHD16291.1 ATP/GTP-binding protein [Streptomyces finlayi]